MKKMLLGTSWGTHWESEEHVKNANKTCREHIGNILGTSKSKK